MAAKSGWKLLVVREGRDVFFAVTRGDARQYCAGAGLALLRELPFDLPVSALVRVAAERLLRIWEQLGAKDRANPSYLWVRGLGSLVVAAVSELGLKGDDAPPER